MGVVFVLVAIELRDSVRGRPSLCTVYYARYFDGVLNHSVNDDEGKR